MNEYQQNPNQDASPNQYHNYQQQPSFPPYPPQINSIRTNSKSISALVLGILAIVIPYLGFILGIIAIVFARLALKEIRAKGEQGSGMAVAGLVCGIVGTILYGLIIVIFAALILLL